LQELAAPAPAPARTALLAGGELGPVRVFITANKAPAAREGQVQLELGSE